ncbi:MULTISPECIES: outer membrane beta-barrel protein [Pseudomonas]|uniref:Outer membrane beta-barrel protein n=1 Tax=Pseudomonas wuhanensis TaxID=2954098 RepID=A0ABY9H164_9PSED|nr:MULTISPECIES: outer membrane beta-barrel protein [unclassified Pseudomonas]WLI15351.1 outer membrane beta-barrel protein [Pseudomonas sp. FP603]WLI21025.1 outer membrane beta-barrel protein [Pseudomonas sp. FP607]
MTIKIHGPFALLMISLCPGTAWSLDPQSIDIYGFDFTPTLLFSESYDDNFRELERAQSSMVTKVAPTFELKAEDRNSATRLIWQPTRYIYHDESDASNTAQRVRLNSIMEFTDRHRLKLDAEARKYERTTSTAVDGINDKIRSNRVNGLYTYGARSAANQIDLGASYAQLRYDNSGGINDDKERDTTGLTTTWYHRIGSNTRGLLEYDHTDFDYQSNNRLNSTSDAVLAGAEWDFTARTSGKVRVGYERKNFDDSSVDDLSNPTWQVDLRWKPRTYSTFSFIARQAMAEGDDGADAVKTTSALFGWRHGWTERITTVAGVGLSRYEYEGQDRTDDLRDYNLAVEYAMRRWLDIELGYRYRNDDSDADNQSFERNIFLLGFNVSL